MNNERLIKIRKQMKEKQFQQLILSSTDAIYYLLEEEIHPGERMMVLLISEYSCHLFLNALFPMSKNLGVELITYTDVDNPIALLSTFIRKRSSIGIDKDWPSHFLIELMQENPTNTFEIGSPAIDLVRINKDGAEITKLKEASKINDKVMHDVFSYLKENADNKQITEIEIQKLVIELNANYGVHEMSFTPLICFGENGAQPHHDSDLSILEKNQAIIIDIGGRINGYCSDMTRSFYYGEPTEEYEKVYSIVKKANLAAIAKIKPGVKLSEIDAAARQLISESGYGDYFTHRTGHGIGINVHEFPDVSAISDYVCEVGMAFSVEPGVYLPNKFGIRIEDLVIVTENGCDILNDYTKELSTI